MFESTGPGGRQDVMGLYRLTNQLAQGFPVYKHVETETYVFVGPNGYWRVGPDTATWRGSLLKYPKKSPTPPNPPATGWNYWTFRWEEDADMKFLESGNNIFYLTSYDSGK